MHASLQRPPLTVLRQHARQISNSPEPACAALVRLQRRLNQNITCEAFASLPATAALALHLHTPLRGAN